MENSESSQKVEADGTMGMVIGSMHPSKKASECFGISETSERSGGCSTFVKNRTPPHYLLIWSWRIRKTTLKRKISPP